MDNWISVNDRLPEDGEWVIAAVKNKEYSYSSEIHYVDGKWKVSVPWEVVTHWMPLPEPPEARR